MGQSGPESFKEAPITMVVDSEDVYLRIFTLASPDGPGLEPHHTRVPFPRRDPSFLHAIAPIGTKFDPPEAHGPAGQINKVPRHGRTHGATAFLRFGE